MYYYVMAVWLIVKGFNLSTLLPASLSHAPRVPTGTAHGPRAATSNDSRSTRQASTGVDDLHALDQEPQCQPDFSHQAHGEPGVVDRGVVRQ